jgi:hypothetical protein
MGVKGLKIKHPVPMFGGLFTDYWLATNKMCVKTRAEALIRKVRREVLHTTYSQNARMC